MPVVAINLSPRLYSAVAEMIDEGKYGAPEQFLEVAIFNQIALERGKAIGVSMNADPEQSSVGDPVPNQRNTTPGPTPAESKNRVRDDRQLMKAVVARLANAYWRNSLPAPMDVATDAESERIWGQVNRLFPLKLACRWLAVNAADSGAWPRLRSINDELANDAACVGSGLELLDTSLKRKRDDKLATGLPRRGNSASRDRLISQFVARTTRSGEIYPGAICQFNLARVEFDEIGLTRWGVELASLANPIIDSLDDETTAALSPEERTLFREIVKQSVSMERRDIQTVLNAVTAGNSSPTELNDAVAVKLPDSWTDLAKRTHVAGVLARAADMGLIRRVWKGRNVTYHVSSEVVAQWETPIGIPVEQEEGA